MTRGRTLTLIEQLNYLMPPDLPLWSVAVLVALSAFTSFISAAFGLGGGVMLLAAMAALLPAAVLIPVHGVVQIGSNAGRAIVMAKYIKPSVLIPFAIGTMIGAGIGGLIAVRVPDWFLYLGLGCFVLWAAWGKGVPAFGRSAVAAGGVVSSFLTMFFGATGPFVASVIKSLNLGRLEHVGTFAACMVAQHTVKIIVFGLLGFAYAPYAGLIVAMIATGFLGTLVGRKLLHGMGDDRFQKALKIVLTLLALRLIWSGVSGLLTFA
jgi:uncharacterized membrane protein YfcA